MKRLILSLGALAALATGPALADTVVYASPQVSVVYESYPSYAYYDEVPAYYVEYREEVRRPVTHYHRQARGHRYDHRHDAGCGHRHRHGRGHWKHAYH